MIQPVLSCCESIDTDLSVFLDDEESEFYVYLGVALLERVSVSPEKIDHKIRQLVAVAGLTVLERTEELKLHIYAALNVGNKPEDVAEVIFQMGIYGGMPIVNSALNCLKEILIERGEWEDFIK